MEKKAIVIILDVKGDIKSVESNLQGFNHDFKLKSDENWECKIFTDAHSIKYAIYPTDNNNPNDEWFYHIYLGILKDFSVVQKKLSGLNVSFSGDIGGGSYSIISNFVSGDALSRAVQAQANAQPSQFVVDNGLLNSLERFAESEQESSENGSEIYQDLMDQKKECTKRNDDGFYILF